MKKALKIIGVGTISLCLLGAGYLISSYSSSKPPVTTAPMTAPAATTEPPAQVVAAQPTEAPKPAEAPKPEPTEAPKPAPTPVPGPPKPAPAPEHPSVGQVGDTLTNGNWAISLTRSS
jgi:hypothetical protein